MDRAELSDVAWELVEHCRASLVGDEVNTAFVLLGIGEYGEAMVLALEAVVRGPNPALPAELLARLAHLPHTHFVDDQFVALLDTLTGRPVSGVESALTAQKCE
ncbi:hypothetical protein [Mycobacterium sp. SMC-4]|uniref:hypothetical protein n=1 Tax=Mycobacterium sp. SMC-4 TaxID=2857059 RepID=UPI0021B4C054|nr:hypothetical protein [Mycobacterium sp. SMC-4]UXA18815.1 hypothetical protein KXD98_03765 [Mycobacterium sp. SMC-4]